MTYQFLTALGLAALLAAPVAHAQRFGTPAGGIRGPVMTYKAYDAGYRGAQGTGYGFANDMGASVRSEAAEFGRLRFGLGALGGTGATRFAGPEDSVNSEYYRLGGYRGNEVNYGFPGYDAEDRDYVSPGEFEARDAGAQDFSASGYYGTGAGTPITGYGQGTGYQGSTAESAADYGASPGFGMGDSPRYQSRYRASRSDSNRDPRARGIDETRHYRALGDGLNRFPSSPPFPPSSPPFFPPPYPPPANFERADIDLDDAEDEDVNGDDVNGDDFGDEDFDQLNQFNQDTSRQRNSPQGIGGDGFTVTGQMQAQQQSQQTGVGQGMPLGAGTAQALSSPGSIGSQTFQAMGVTGGTPLNANATNGTGNGTNGNNNGAEPRPGIADNLQRDDFQFGAGSGTAFGGDFQLRSGVQATRPTLGGGAAPGEVGGGAGSALGLGTGQQGTGVPSGFIGGPGFRPGQGFGGGTGNFPGVESGLDQADQFQFGAGAGTAFRGDFQLRSGVQTTPRVVGGGAAPGEVGGGAGSALGLGTGQQTTGVPSGFMGGPSFAPGQGFGGGMGMGGMGGGMGTGAGQVGVGGFSGGVGGGAGAGVGAGAGAGVGGGAGAGVGGGAGAGVGGGAGAGVGGGAGGSVGGGAGAGAGGGGGNGGGGQ